MADILTGKRVLVTGAGGFLGQHVCARLQARGVLVEVNRVNMRDYDAGQVSSKPDLVVHLAADVKGISLNRLYPYGFLASNTEITLTLMRWLYHWKQTPDPQPDGEVEQPYNGWRDVPVVAAGSICAYPNDAPIPFQEKYFWRGKPDPNNLGYGMAKRFLAGALECAYEQWGQRYAHLIMANLYGPGDHFDEQNGHVIPGLIKRMNDAIKENAPEFVVWGTGKATRDFLYVEDAAKAFVYAAEAMLIGGYRCMDVNLGSGIEVSIERTVAIIANIMGYQGKIRFDRAKPDGQMRRKVDAAKADVLLDWYAPTPLREGLEKTIDYYRSKVAA